MHSVEAADETACASEDELLQSLIMGNVSIYLNDHLAGSVAALELLDHLIETSSDPAFDAFLTTLKNDIEADQHVLENLLLQLGEEQSAVRKAGAWVLEKISRLKLQANAEDSGLGVFQALEALALGITGKCALWRSLASASKTVKALGGLDYPHLEKRAAEQFERIQAKALELAPTVLKQE